MTQKNPLQSQVDDDIVRHTDLLSSPIGKNNVLSPNRRRLPVVRKSRHSSPSKKNNVERIVPAVLKSTSVNLTAQLDSAGVVRSLPDKVTSLTKQSDVETTKDVGNGMEKYSNGSEPVTVMKKKRGRPRKEEILARMKTQQQQRQEESEITEMEAKTVPKTNKKSEKIIKLDLSTDNILPPRSPRRTASQLRKKFEVEENSSDKDETDEMGPNSDLDTSKDFTPEGDSANESGSNDDDDDDTGEMSVVDDEDELVIKTKSPLEEEPPVKPTRKRGRARKDKSNENTPDLGPVTPKKKKTEERSASKDYDFVSPLKKRILDNLQQLKGSNQPKLLRLDKDFVPAPLPNALYKPRQIVTKVNDFLDTFEGYLDQKKSSRREKSGNTMAAAPEVTRDEFALISNLFNKMFLKKKREKLYELQNKMFSQYWFELTQGFTLLFYGIGSKREFLEKFAVQYLSPKLKQIQLYLNDDQKRSPTRQTKEQLGVPCIVINGYNPTCSYRDVFKDVSNILFPEELARSETKYWGNHVIIQVNKMIAFYETQPRDIKLILVVHNIDGPSVRKELFQAMLSALAQIKQIAIVASVDHIYAPLLWDNKKAQNYNFIFHDVTNYEPYSVESSFHDVMKMGKRDTVTGAEGAKYVLESLTINSKKLFKLLVETQISKLQKEKNGNKVPPMKRSSPTSGLEFQHLAQLCAQEFIASNDISLRTMLREFIEHNMITISKTTAGVEYVWVPYNYSELTRLQSTVLAGIE